MSVGSYVKEHKTTAIIIGVIVIGGIAYVAYTYLAAGSSSGSSGASSSGANSSLMAAEISSQNQNAALAAQVQEASIAAGSANYQSVVQGATAVAGYNTELGLGQLAATSSNEQTLYNDQTAQNIAALSAESTSNQIYNESVSQFDQAKVGAQAAQNIGYYNAQGNVDVAAENAGGQEAEATTNYLENSNSRGFLGGFINGFAGSF